MSWLAASEVPLAVRVVNGRGDYLITGWLHEAPKFDLNDPGGLGSGSFVVSQRLGWRDEILQDYSRVQYLDKCTGEIVYEGDITHPGRKFGPDGALVEVTVDGGKERLHDWNGPRIYCDSDLTPWVKTPTALINSTVEAGDDMGGSGDEALNLGIPLETHVEANYRSECVYKRIAEAGQKLGRVNYRFDGGHTSGSPGWLVRLLASSPSVVARSNILNVGGVSTSAAYFGPSWADTCIYAYLQLIWTSGSSSTGNTGVDVTWASIMDLTVVPQLLYKDGSARAGVDTNDYVTAVQVWEDMLGDPLLLANSFNGAGAQLDVGTGFQWTQLAFPDSIDCAGIAEELMKGEQGCTYLVGPSDASGKYTLTWLQRPSTVRYEAMVWIDEWDGGIQPVEQYNRAVSRWKTKTGNIRITVGTQAIPEMDDVARVRTYWQDLGDNSGTDAQAAQANATVLQDHRYAKNGGRLQLARPIVDLYTGRRINPWEVQPANLMRMVGVEPTADGLNVSTVTPNGSTVCRIVNTSYDGPSNTLAVDLDSTPWGVFRAIAEARRKYQPVRKR